jgi:hypothetical protein
MPAPAVRESGVPARPQGRPPVKVLVAAAAAVLAVVTVIAMLALRPDDAGKDADKTAAPAASAPPTTAGAAPTSSAPAATPSAAASSQPAGPDPSPTAGGTGQLPPLPAGWIDYRDPTGFSVYVPAGWRQSREGTIMYFRGNGRVLGIDQTDKPKSDPVKDWQGQRDARLADGDFPNYVEVHIRPVPYFVTAADWEFTFGRGTRQHVNNRGVVTSPKQAYGFYWQTSDADWAAARADLDLVFASFRPRV